MLTQTHSYTHAVRLLHLCGVEKNEALLIIRNNEKAGTLKAMIWTLEKDGHNESRLDPHK